MNEVMVVVLEVVVISATVIFFLTLLGNYIYKKIKGLPTGECACCHKSTKKMVKDYHKQCCCDKNK